MSGRYDAGPVDHLYTMADQPAAERASPGSFTHPAVHPRLLVIGYGNELRGDDAVGPLVARAVAAWDLPDVRALAVQQLTPELAEPLAQAQYAVFVDAGLVEAQTAPAAAEPITAHPVTPAGRGSAIGHTSDPRQLLALARVLYGAAPRAWQVMVPASTFDIGAALSPLARQGVASALQLIRDYITTARSQAESAAVEEE